MYAHLCNQPETLAWVWGQASYINWETMHKQSGRARATTSRPHRPPTPTRDAVKTHS